MILIPVCAVLFGETNKNVKFVSLCEFSIKQSSIWECFVKNFTLTFTIVYDASWIDFVTCVCKLWVGWEWGGKLIWKNYLFLSWIWTITKLMGDCI